MKGFLKHNWNFISLYIIVVSVSVFYLLQYDKCLIHATMNKMVGNPFFDTFFKYITHIGDGIVAILITVIVLMLNAKKGVYVLITYVVSGLTTNILKTYVFDVNRPHFVFGFYGHLMPQYNIKFIDGIEMLGLNSFPSGHSTTSFAIFMSIAIITQNKLLKIVFFIFALLGAFSRVYISQHWLVDVTVGSIIGTIAAILFYFLLMNERAMVKLDKPLLKIFNP